MTEQSPAESIFFAALEKGTPEERVAYLDAACGDDANLRQRVERLLAAHPQVGSFLESPVQGEVDAVEARTIPPSADFRSLEDFGNLPGLVETTSYRSPSERVGSVIAGRYKLLETLGQGGMGAVFMAQQTEPVKRLVALKLIKLGMDSRQVLIRFEAERQALALMDHPHIAKVLDAGATDSGRLFFVMELVKGVPITRFCDERQLSPRERLDLFIPVCHAIQHAHQKGVIHRDIKPTNVLVALYDDRPVPKVIDFGVAKAAGSQLTDASLVTGFGAIVGTPEYMSPEQAQLNQLDIDTRSDVYALGILLYELLTGTTPIDKKRLGQDALLEILRVIREEEPPRPSTRLSTSEALASIAATRKTEPAKLAKLMRGELDWIVMKCLEKERSRRYETANGLARDLERYLHDEVVEARPPTAGYRLRKFVRRNKGRVVAGSLLAAMLLLMIGLIAYGAWWADKQSAERRHEQALIAARNNDAIKATLDRVEAALKEGRIDEAGTLLGQADRQMEEQAAADLRARHQQLKRDERTVRELNDIFEERWMISRSDTRLDNTRAKRRYPALFQNYDLAVGREPAAQTVEKIHRSLIRDAISSGVAEWFFVDPKYPGLLAVTDLLDSEPVRAALRAAIVAGDMDLIAKLAKSIDGSKLSPAFAIGLAIHNIGDVSILKAAWTAHPDSFALALTIGSHLFGLDDKLTIDAIGWSRTAVALRPNNPLSHYRLALALDDFGSVGDNPAAVEELRRAIQLAPKFARAHGKLAILLRNGHKNTEALAAAHKAIEFDNKSLHHGHVVILWDLMAKKEYVEAAKVYQRIAAMQSEESLFAQSGPEEGYEGPFAAGAMSAANGDIQIGLIRARRPFEAYRFQLKFGNAQPVLLPPLPDGQPYDTAHYNIAGAAALAGTGQGLDAPPPAERPAIRKHALEWLTSTFYSSKEQAAAFLAWCARSVALIGSPIGHGPLLAASGLLAGSPDLSAERSRDRKVVHERMNQWLNDADLARVRDDDWLAKLPADEREQWRKLWSEVRSLRDRTAPHKAAPPVEK